MDMEIVNTCKNFDELLREDYERAVSSECFNGTFEAFKVWSQKYCWGVMGNCHFDPPGELGKPGLPGLA